MRHREVNSPRLPQTAAQFGVCGGVVAGDTLYISGQTPLDAEFNVQGKTFEEQARRVFDAITTVLREAGFVWEDMVKMTAFVHADRSALETYCAILKEYLARYSSRAAVAHTYMLMGEMQVPGMMIEVDAVAVKQR